jgi:hypothetical protein
VRNNVREKIQSMTLLFACCGSVGCSGDGTGLDENGRPVGEPNGPLVAQFASIQEHVFTPLCTGCHAGAGAPLGLRLTEDAAYAALVNAPSVEVPSLQRVAPGNPAASYMLQKISGTAAVGGRMPLGGPPLSSDMIATIQQWIADGAQAPAASAMLADSNAKITASLPMNASTLTLHSGGAAVVLSADVELDATSLDASTISLMRSGGDGRFDDGNEITVPIQPVELRTQTPTIIAITPRDPWIVDRYRLSVAGSGASTVRDLRGLPIDGDTDGQPGGDFILEFDVSDQFDVSDLGGAAR